MSSNSTFPLEVKKAKVVYNATYGVLIAAIIHRVFQPFVATEGNTVRSLIAYKAWVKLSGNSRQKRGNRIAAVKNVKVNCSFILHHRKRRPYKQPNRIKEFTLR